MIREEETDKFLILLRLFSLFLLESSRSRNFLFPQDTFVAQYEKSLCISSKKRHHVSSPLTASRTGRRAGKRSRSRSSLLEPRAEPGKEKKKPTDRQVCCLYHYVTQDFLLTLGLVCCDHREGDIYFISFTSRLCDVSRVDQSAGYFVSSLRCFLHKKETS